VDQDHHDRHTQQPVEHGPKIPSARFTIKEPVVSSPLGDNTSIAPRCGRCMLCGTMTLLIVGVALFIGAHLIPSVPSLRDRLKRQVGGNAYRGLFALVSLVGFVLVVMGMGRASSVPLWDPPAWGHRVPVFVMPVALILFVAAFMPTNLKRLTRHPMLWGVTLWAAVHLVANNGDLASLILFGSFGAFSLFDMWSANQRGTQLSSKAVPYWRDLLVVVVGGVVFMGLLHSHAMLFGMPVSLGM